MEDYSHASHRNQASTAIHSKKISTANGSCLTPKTVYDDVFGGPPKFGIPTFSPRFEDYSEIFCSFHSSRGSSIPVLDIPVPDARDVFPDVRPSKFDYSEIFGGLNGVDFFDSHEDLFSESKGGESSFEETWTPAGTASPSEGSIADTLDCAENNQFMSDGVAHHKFDGLKHLNVSNPETVQRSEENRTNDTTHGAPHQAVLVDGSTPPQKTQVIDASFCAVNEFSGNADCNKCLLEEKDLKKTLSLPPLSCSITRISGSDYKLQRRSHEKGSDSNDIFLTVSEISLRTQPCQVPPPMRQPPKFSDKKGVSKIASEKYGLDSAIGDSPPPLFDVEVDANSSAAASAAAMKEAMEKAQARLKSAKESMERKRDGLQSRLKLGLKDDSSRKARKEDNKATHEDLRSRGDVSQEASEREDIGVKGFERQEGQKDTRTAKVAPNFQGREKGLNVGKEILEEKFMKEPRSDYESCIDNKAGEWRVEKQIYELAKTDKLNAALEVIEQGKNGKKSMTPIITQKHEKSEKVAVKQVFEQREENVKKSKTSNEACVQENTRILEAAKEAHELKKLKKKLKMAQEMSQCEGNEKKLKVAQEICELEEDENRRKVACKLEENEKKVKEAQEICDLEEDGNKLKVACELEEQGKTLQQAHKQKENEKKLEEAREWEETEKRQRGASWREVSEGRLNDANEQEENGKKLKESCKREEKEKRLKDSCEREEGEKKIKEACKSEFNGRRLQEVHEKEENDKRKKDAPEQEENEKQWKEVREQEENEKGLQDTHEHEENEKRLKHAFEREEYEKRLKEAHELKESESRLKELCKMEENEKQLKEVFELLEDEPRQREAYQGGKNGNRRKSAFEWEESENKVKANQEALDLKVDKNLMTATGSCKPVNDNNLEANQQAPKYDKNSRKLKLAPEAIEHEGSGRMTEAAKDACDCEGNGKDLKIVTKTGNEEDKSGRDRPTDVAQCAPEQDRREKIKDSIESLSLDEHENKLGESEIATNLKQNEKNKRTSQVACDQESLGNSQVLNDQEAYQKSDEAAEWLKKWIENEKKTGVVQPAMSLEEKRNLQKIAQEVNRSQGAERKEKNYHETCSYVEREKERLQIEREYEEERLRKIEEEKEQRNEREKDRMAVERVTREARERAERAAVGRATSEAHQRAMTEAREKIEKASAEAREKSLAEKALMDARLRAERGAVERATVAAREHAAEKAALDAKGRAEKSSDCPERSVADKFSMTYSRDSGMRQNFSFPDPREPQILSSGSDSSSRYTDSSVHGASCTSGKFQGTEGEPARRCKARLERHQRTVERVAKALAEKNMRDLLAQRELAERNRLAETLDAEIRRWSSGKAGNLRALLSTLQYILGPDSGWQPIPLTEVITAVAVKKAYRKATLYVHPDKLQQKGASIQHKYICEKIFDLLKDAWNKFNSEER